jgi:hypothetical protein
MYRGVKSPSITKTLTHQFDIDGWRQLAEYLTSHARACSRRKAKSLSTPITTAISGRLSTFHFPLSTFHFPRSQRSFGPAVFQHRRANALSNILPYRQNQGLSQPQNRPGDGVQADDLSANSTAQTECPRSSKGVSSRTESSNFKTQPDHAITNFRAYLIKEGRPPLMLNNVPKAP